MPEQKPREIAYDVLAERARAMGHTEDLLQSKLERSTLKPADRGLCQELVYGVARRQRTLDWLIERKAPGKRQVQGIQDALRLGLYQLFWLDRVPDHAAVYETVNLVRAHGMQGLSGFVNAVLRRYSAERDATLALLSSMRETDPGIAFSHPDWMIRRWKARWGWPDTLKLLEWNNETPKVYARVNSIKATSNETIERWKSEAVAYEEIGRDWVPSETVYRLANTPGLMRLESFRRGFYYIQDPSTLLAPTLLDPKAEETVLDFCSAPGGKTTFMAQLARNLARIVALDTDETRLALVRENCERLGVHHVTSLTPEQFSQRHQGQLFEKVLVDAPCSNTGVLRRRVDVRWRISREGIDSQATEQLKILAAAASHTRNGGTVVYSTCSLEPEENRAVVDAFLAENPGFSLQSDRELTPMRDEVDGAYVAVLKKGLKTGRTATPA